MNISKNLKTYLIIPLAMVLSTSLVSAKTNIEKAGDFAEAGVNLMFFKDFVSAEEMLAKAVTLAPKTSNYRLKYAQALIRNGKYQMAVETLEKGSFSANEKAERDLLFGMAYFHLGKDEEAKASLQAAQSGDAGIAEKAKSFLGAMATLRKRFTANVQFGVLFDSQVIDEDLITGVDEGDGRIFSAADIEYRYKKMSFGDLSFRAGVASFFSFDSNHSLADPLKLELQAPIRFSKMNNGKDFSYILTPGIDFVWLDVGNTGSKSVLYWAPGLNVFAVEKGQREHVDAFYGDVQLILGQPGSLENTDSDIDGAVFRAGWKRQKFVDRSKEKFWLVDGFGEVNTAEGDNINSVKAGASYGYFLPFKGLSVGAIGDGKLSIYPGAKSTDSSSTRRDLLLSAGGLAQKPLNSWLKVEGRASASVNISNLDARDYTRFIIGAFLKGNWRF